VALPAIETLTVIDSLYATFLRGDLDATLELSATMSSGSSTALRRSRLQDDSVRSGARQFLEALNSNPGE
jgi:hypothetical protein